MALLLVAAVVPRGENLLDGYEADFGEFMARAEGIHTHLNHHEPLLTIMIHNYCRGLLVLVISNH